MLSIAFLAECLGDLGGLAVVFLFPGGNLRIIIGVAVLMVLAITDLTRHGKSATRWREYSFLLLCVGIAMVYGMVNDQVTSRISWEYFYFGKELAPIMGPQTPPDRAKMDWQAARIGAAATWWVGLVIGAAMLIANNPSRKYPQLSYHKLIGRLPAFFGIVVLCAGIFGWLGHQYLLNLLGQDFREIAEMNLWRPRRFMTVYGIHLGGYFGGIAGMIFSVVRIRLGRRRMSYTSESTGFSEGKEPSP